MGHSAVQHGAGGLLVFFGQPRGQPVCVQIPAHRRGFEGEHELRAALPHHQPVKRRAGHNPIVLRQGEEVLRRRPRRAGACDGWDFFVGVNYVISLL